MVTPLPINPQSRPWLLLALGAIGLSALFAILLVVARTPLLQQLFGGADLFHTVLVLHVNFSVLVWLLSFGAVLWSLNIHPMHTTYDSLSFAMVIGGAFLISFSPLLHPPPQPVMSNYIPILHSSAFLAGLCSFAVGIGMYALRRTFVPGDGCDKLAATALVAALLVFALSTWRLPTAVADSYDFETLFWGGGHMLQFVYLLLLLAAWQKLLGLALSARHYQFLKLLTLLMLAGGLLLAVLPEPGTQLWRDGFTQLMRYGTPFLILPALALTWRVADSSVRLSQILLLAGLVLGLLIRGDTVSVTAHYHATNAAITLAFMALCYQLFYEFGLGRPSAYWVKRQLQLYFFGMSIYISGMALSGQLDVPRKVVMATEGLQALAMGLMGIGGLIAITATLMFVFILLHTIKTQHTSLQRHGEHNETTS